MGVPTDAMSIMLVEQARGVSPEASVLAPLSEEYAAMWQKLLEDSARITAAGYIVDIPAEIPSLDGYRLGYAPPLVDMT